MASPCAGSPECAESCAVACDRDFPERSHAKAQVEVVHDEQHDERVRGEQPGGGELEAPGQGRRHSEEDAESVEASGGPLERLVEPHRRLDRARVAGTRDQVIHDDRTNGKARRREHRRDMQEL